MVHEFQLCRQYFSSENGLNIIIYLTQDRMNTLIYVGACLVSWCIGVKKFPAQ